MTVRFACPHCHKGLSAPDRAAGSKARCPGCGTRVVIPGTAGKAAKSAKAAPGRSAARTGGSQAAAAPSGTFDEEPPLRFAGRPVADEGLDMTPMADVTFLLLIFFMVTAAFALQKSLEIPPPDQQEQAAQARTIEELEEDDDYVIVRIERDSSVWVDDSEAPSEQELLVRLREARRGGGGGRGPSNLLVLADGDARHETVVMALDAGNAVGMEFVRLATMDEVGF